MTRKRADRDELDIELSGPSFILYPQCTVCGWIPVTMTPTPKGRLPRNIEADVTEPFVCQECQEKVTEEQT